MKRLAITVVVALYFMAACSTPGPTASTPISVTSRPVGSSTASSPSTADQCGGPVAGAVPACSQIPTALPTGASQVVAIPSEPTPAPGQAALCPQALFGPFTLVVDPTKLPAVWGVTASGDVFPIMWPAGFTARFMPALQIVDPSGAVVAIGGVVIAAAGGGGGYICTINGKTY